MAKLFTRKTSEVLIKGKALGKQGLTDMERNESHEGPKSCRSGGGGVPAEQLKEKERTAQDPKLLTKDQLKTKDFL